MNCKYTSANSNKARAGENAEFEDVYRCLEGPYEHENGASKRKRFAADSPEGKTLLDLSMSDLDHRDMPWTDIAKEAGIKAARSTIEKLFHENNVFRYVARLKPLLTQRMKDNRVKLAELGLTIDIRRIVFTDEMWIEFNSSRRKTHQTRFKGENPFEVAKTKNNDSATIRLMFWSAINSLLGPAPGYIYPKVNADDKKHQQEVQQAVNKIRQEEVVKKVKLSYQAGTRESEEVEAANRMVDELNLAEGRVGRSRRHYRTPEQVFRVKEIKAQTKGGINWVAYREQVLQPILYPWITGYLQPLLLSETGDSTVWLVEDNAPAHQAAQTIDFEDRLKMNIKTFNWPAHSPDLNKIEQAWDYEKVITTNNFFKIFHLILISI